MKEIYKLFYDDFKECSQILYHESPITTYTIKKKSNKIYITKRNSDKVIDYKEFSNSDLDEAFRFVISANLSYIKSVIDYKER